MSEVSIVSIGAGNLAHHFIPALHKKGCNILQVFSRNLDNSKKLALKVKATATDDLEDIYTDADLYLIMVHDDAIRSVINALPQLNEHQILAHSSGATPTLLLAKKSMNYGSFYALQSFKKHQSQDLAEVPFLIFGNNSDATRRLRMLARQLSPIVKEVDDNDRLRYHLAAVLMNNFTNHLACKTREFLKEHTLDPAILQPIIAASFDKIIINNPCEIQTGPAIRNDLNIEAKHLKLIEQDAYLTAIYKSHSQSIKNSNQQKIDDENS